jgi:hypothetical protein
MLKWLKRVYSEHSDSSYGRLISTASFVVFVVLNWCVAVNPWKIFDTLTYIPQVNDYLFYLVLGGYSITILKDIAKIIMARFGIAVPKDDKEIEDAEEDNTKKK